MDWQQPIALALVVLAAVWLVRTQILTARRGSCGGCGGCGSAGSVGDSGRRAAVDGSPLIQVDLELPGRSRAAEEGATVAAGRPTLPTRHAD
jgi:hypothetical protein